MPTIQLKITPAGMGLQVRAPDRRDQHHLGPAGNADTWASPETQWIRNPGAAAQRALTPAQVGRPRTCGWCSSASLRAPVQRRRGQITRTLRGERSGAGGDRRLQPSPDPFFFTDGGGGTDGTLSSLTDEGELDGVEMLNDAIGTRRHSVVVQVHREET